MANQEIERSPRTLLRDLFKQNVSHVVRLGSFLGIPAAGLVVVAYVFVQINNTLGYFSYNLKHPVNKNSCSCQCWDGFYRSKYPRTSHNTEYKVFYFNYEQRFLFIIYLIYVTIKVTNRILSKIFRLVYQDVKLLVEKYSENRTSYRKTLSLQSYSLRPFATINILFALQSHIYATWACVNYLNEFDNRMLNSQLFFMVTELVPAYIYYISLDRFASKKKTSDKLVEVTAEITIERLLPIISISLLHLFMAIKEKVLWGFVISEYRINLKRDIVLVFSDILGLLFATFYASKLFANSRRELNRDRYSASSRRRSFSRYFDPYYRLLVAMWAAFMVFLFCFYKLKCEFIIYEGALFAAPTYQPYVIKDGVKHFIDMD